MSRLYLDRRETDIAELKAGTSVRLKPGFRAFAGCSLKVYIDSTAINLTRFYYLKDHLGSIRVTVNQSGEEVVSHDDYDPWGMQLDGRSGNLASAFDKYKFTGKERDVETGYDYFGARYYDSRIARWLQVDPMAEKYPGWSPYNYVMNNPLKFIDPIGMDIADYFYSDGSYIGSDDKKDGRVFVLKEGENSNYEKNITELQDKSTEIEMDSELGTVIRTVYAEMRGGDDNAKSIVAESIRNRFELPKGTYERAGGTYSGIVNKFYDVAKKGDGANGSFLNPKDYIYKNSVEKNAWISSVSASLRAVNSKSNVGKGVIFYHSADSKFWDNNKKLEKIILDNLVKGVKGLWKLK